MNKKIHCAAMLLASAIIMLLETLFFHVLVYINNYLEATGIISVALLGIALGGVVGYYVGKRTGTSLLAYFALATGVTTALCIPNFIFLPKYLTYPVLLVLPFLGASVIVAILFGRLPKHSAYFWNLLGAAAGVLLVCYLIPTVQSENAILLGVALAGLTALLLSSEAKARWLAGTLSLLLLLSGTAACLWNIQTRYFDLGTATRAERPQDAGKTFGRTKQNNVDLVYVRDNLVGRVDILKSKGKSSFSVHQEGVVSDIVMRRKPSSYDWDCRIPKALVMEPSILVIGTSAEGVTKTAKHMSPETVVGIEINPGIVDLMRNELYEPSARAYDDIELHVTDARTYLEGTDRQFDLMTLMNAHTRGRVTDNVGMPQYLFTEEAFTLMFDRLTDRGALILEEVLENSQSRRFSQRIFATAIAGLRNHGIEDGFQRHFYAYTFRGRFLLFIIKKTPFAEQEVRRMDDWFAKRKGVKKERMAMMVHPTRDLKSDFACFVRDPQGSIATAAMAEKLDLSPISDNKPFLYDINARHPEAWRMVALSAAATLVLILLPSLFLLRRAKGSGNGWGGASLVFFSLIGTAYMLVEIALMQKYQLYLGSPTYALVLVLTSILFFSSLGGLISGRFSGKAIMACTLAIPLLLMAYSLLLGKLFAATQPLPFGARTAVALASLFPLFFCMGVPFPYGLRFVEKRYSAEHIGLLYGVNGAFGTLGVTLSVLLSVYAGFATTFYLGMGLYVLAFLIIRTQQSTS